MKNLIIVLATIIILVAGIFIGININYMMRNNHNNLYNKNNIANIDDNDIKTDVKVDTDIEKVNTEKDIKVETGIKDNQVNVSKPKEVVKEDTKETYSTNDKSVIDSLNDTLNNIKNSEVTEKFKDSAKKTFIDIVDFLFYDGTIKGVTFDELTESGKAKVLELANKIDEAIEAKVPNYKDTISEKASSAFKEISALIKKGSSNLNDFLKSKLSEEHYNAIINSKDDLVYYSKNAISFIKENGSKLLSEAKDKLSAWYSKYKNS